MDDMALRAAAGLEFLQACALIHDDVMDGSDTRRGLPAAHRRFAGVHRDAEWLGLAGGVRRRRGHPARRPLPVAGPTRSCSDAASRRTPWAARRRVYDEMRTELMAGQYLDLLEQAMGGGSVERALKVVRYKSAKYTIERPLHLGAALAGDDPAVRDAYSGYGLPLGEAFQLRDDILGVFGDPAETGKPAGDDLREGKRTVLIAIAVERSTPAQASVIRRHLGDPGLDATGVDALREIISATGALRLHRGPDRRAAGGVPRPRSHTTTLDTAGARGPRGPRLRRHQEDRLMRTVTGPTDHVVVVGAGLAGLSAAMRLAGAGRKVTVVEREAIPGRPRRPARHRDRRRHLPLRHRVRPC